MKNKLIALILLNVGLFLITPFSILAEGETIFLPADCSTYGVWDAGNQTCTLTQDLTESVEITADNITLDCNGHSITGPGSGHGIYLNTGQGVTIERCLVNNFDLGIDFSDSSNNQITENDIFNNNFFGLSLMCSSNNIITENNIFENGEIGLYLSCLVPASNNLVYHNNFINNGEQIVDEDPPNFFDNGYPEGGNYYNDYVGIDLYSGPDQEEPGSDGIGDTPYTFPGGQDRYPFMEENGWKIPVNQPPAVSQLNQYKSDGQTEILESGITTESSPDNPYNSLVVFKAKLNDPDGDDVKLEVELKEFNQPFDGTGILESDFVSPDTTTSITRYGLIDGQYHWRARAVDVRGAVSDWQEFGTPGNADFEVKLVPLYTQIRSPYPSDNETKIWADLEYARGFTETYTCGSKIYQCGCAITSIVMIARYYDVLEAQGKDVNPGTINEWLKKEPGGYINGDVNWIAAAKYTDWRIKYVKTDKIPSNYTLLDEYLDKNQPVIAKEINPGHFIVIDNKLATTYGVKDPAWYNTKKLDELTTDWSSKIRDYNNNFYGLRIYKKGDGIAQSAITLALGSPAELLIIDPQGRKLGKDENGIEYQEIPEAWYFEDGFDDPTGENPSSQERNKLIQILEPIDGQYQLYVIGAREGVYSLNSNFYDTQGNTNHQEFQSETAPGYTAQYHLSFDPSNSASTTIKLFDETPPEAEIYFDSNTQKLVVKGTDNTTVKPIVSIVSSDKKQTIYQIKDEAGNTTKLYFDKLKQKGKQIKVELEAIQYNKEPIIKSEAKLKYEWSLNKGGTIKELEQRIKVNDQFDVKAKYNHQKNNTEIKIKLQDQEKQKQTFSGIKIIKLITKSGVLEFEF